MQKTYNTKPILKTLQTAKNALILLPQNPSLDAAAAALALYLALSKNQLNTTIGCDTPMTVNFNRLFGVDKIKPRIGNQNLVISFTYPEDSLEKVSYDKDSSSQKFHLTIIPKAGKEPLDASQVQYSYTGSTADLIFVISTRSLEDLGHLYQQEKTLLDNKEKTLINLSSLDKNAQFGTVNIYDPTASGSSEIMFSVLKALNLPLEQDIATNLLAGIESATNNFATAKTADIFASVAELMNLGAKKGHVASVSAVRQNFPGSTSPFTGLRTQPSSLSSRVSKQTIVQPQTQLKPKTPPPLPGITPPQSPPPFQSPPPQSPLLQPAPSSLPSPDWLKPKIVTTSNPKI